MRSIINEKNLNNKKILLRLDLNVPINRGKITDTTRIDKILPTLNFLIKEKAKIIILSHVGRPKGKIVKELSLKPIGGSKISTKINVIKNLIPKFDNIIIVGGMANNFIEYFGNSVGKSIKEKNCNKIVEEIISLSKKEKCKIICPEDVIVSKDLNGSPQKKELSEILSDEMILDIGPKTIDKITKIIDNSKTILWNGPAGYFENPNFAYGSIQIAKKIIENNKANKIFSVAGGGDTVSLLNNLKAVHEFNFVSTAGVN